MRRKKEDQQPAPLTKWGKTATGHTVCNHTSLLDFISVQELHWEHSRYSLDLKN